MKLLSALAISIIILNCAACLHRRAPEEKLLPREPATMRPYQINGKWYHPYDRKPGYTERGQASWYGPGFHGHRAASGEMFNMYALTAAHRTLPMHVYVNVTNDETGKSVIVRINDRGPFVKGRIIDLSRAAAEEIGIFDVGSGPVTIEVLGYEPLDPNQPVLEYPGDVTKGEFFIQIGAFKNYTNAAKLKEELGSTFEVEVQEADTAIGIVQRVLVGPYNDLAKADVARNYFENNGYPDAFVIVVD